MQHGTLNPVNCYRFSPRGFSQDCGAGVARSARVETIRGDFCPVRLPRGGL